MEDKATCVAMDQTVDLIKVRLPFLQKQMRNSDAQHSLKKGASKVAYHTPRSLVSQKFDTSQRNGSHWTLRDNPMVKSGSSETINLSVTDELSDRDVPSMSSFRSRKKEHQLPDNKSMILARYADRSLFLDGRKLQDIDLRSTQLHHQKKKNIIKSADKLPVLMMKSFVDFNGEHAVSFIHRSKSELEIFNQATELLKQSGQNIIKQDIEKFSKGLSTMYLSDYGVHRERTKHTAGMSQQKHISSPEKLDDELESTAQKHIYLCQIPSLMTRGSQARMSVHSLRNTLTPRTHSRGIDNTVYMDDTEGGTEFSSRVSSPKKLVLTPLISDSDGSGLKKSGMYRSFDSLNVKRPSRNRVLDIGIQSTAVPLLVTRKRVM